MRLLVATLGLLFWSFTFTSAQMQDDFFSADPGTYLKQLEEFMTASKRTAQIETYDAFKQYFQTFDPAEVDTIISMSNQMKDRKMKSFPHFNNYLNCLMGVKDKSYDNPALFKNWHEILATMLLEQVSSRDFSAYLQFSRFFFQEKILKYSKIGTNWYADGNNFELGYKDEGATISFESTNLIAKRKNDSIQIKNTAGKFYISTEAWKGKGGEVAWNERFEDLLEKVYVEIVDTFTIDLSKGLYRLPRTRLYYPSYFGKNSIEGSFEDKLSGTRAAVPYPAFESRDKALNIDQFGEGISFRGGFRLKGLTVYGYGSREYPLELKAFNKSNELLYRGSSIGEIIKKDSILIGNQIESTIFYGSQKDSIYHPAVSIRLNVLSKELRLSRGDRGSERNPFFSSYHNMNIDVERINIIFNENYMVIGSQKEGFGQKANVTFESLNFFSENEFRKWQPISSSNPLTLIAILVKKKQITVLEADTVAQFLNPRFKEQNIQPLLYELVASGFVDYDDSTHLVFVKEKLVHYVEANQKRVDFDRLSIVSEEPRGANAGLNLKTGEMDIVGVRAVEFSPKQRVAIKPANETIKLLKDRNMQFDGRLFAGYSILTGKGFKFDYDRYLIELDSVDYFDLYLPSGIEQENGEQAEALAIDSRIQGLNGVLLIDAPSNKSGRDSVKMFPSFQSKTSSYVYYDKEEIQKGVYNRDSFYFKLDKFSFNHLDELNPREVRFTGLMYSADIFPLFKEELEIRKTDNSLGFVHETPEEGYPIYQERALFRGTTDLSNKGFLGKGELTYLGANVNSEDVVFRPKQLTASAETFSHAEERSKVPETPQVEGIKVAIDFKPYKDSMYVTTAEKAFDLFQVGSHTLEGTIVLSPGGIKGKGTFDWDKAVMRSELFSYGAFSANSDTSSITIKTTEGETPALKSQNVKAVVDFDTQKANFKVNLDSVMTALPKTRYQTSMPTFDWDMEVGEVAFNTPKEELAEFLSVHPDQDSLTFLGEKALYKTADSKLYIEGVPFIQASDALIYPDSGKVVVEANANIQVLENAKIIANTENKNHVINRATVNIEGQRNYKGSGFYEYNIGDRKQEIEFSDIQGRPVGKGKMSARPSITKAAGKISTRDTFYIDQKTEFQGNISLSAESKNLFFDGFARLDADNIPKKSWFRVRFEGDKSDLIVKLGDTKNPEGIPVETGFFMSKEFGVAYPSVAAPLYFRKDKAILSVEGLMDYLPKEDVFVVADSMKLLDKNVLKGNKLIFDNKQSKISAEGRINIGHDLKDIKIQSAGTIKTDIVPLDSSGLEIPNYSLSIELMSMIDLKIPEKLVSVMSKDFQNPSLTAAEPTEINYLKEPDFYRKTISELMPNDKEVVEALEGLTYGSLSLQSKYLENTFVFAKLPMKWNTDYQSFVTLGSRVGVMSIDGKLLNQVYKGYVERRMPRSGNNHEFNIYVESQNSFFYYFSHKNGILSVSSNNPSFVEATEKLKPKEVVLKADDGGTYEILLVSEGAARRFINRVKAAQK